MRTWFIISLAAFAALTLFGVWSGKLVVP